MLFPVSVTANSQIGTANPLGAFPAQRLWKIRVPTGVAVNLRNGDVTGTILDTIDNSAAGGVDLDVEYGEGLTFSDAMFVQYTAGSGTKVTCFFDGAQPA